MKFDEVLRDIGEFGRYQKRIYALLCIPCVSVGSFCMMTIVVLFTPAHRCKLPNFKNDTYAIQNAYHESLVNVTIPLSSDPTKVYEECQMYRIEGGAEFGGTLGNHSLATCTEWVYDKSVFFETFTSKANLVCGDSLKTSHIMMMYYFGVFVGDLILGLLSDKFGRKKTMYIGLVLLLLLAIAVTWAPEFYSFAVLQFLIGAVAHGSFICLAVLSMEMVGPSKRIWTGMLVQAWFAVGVTYLALVAYLTRSWQYINISVFAPCVLYLTYWWIIPESPRWLLSKGEKLKAVVIIRKTARINKAKYPEEIEYGDVSVSADKPIQEGTIWHVFRSPVLLKRFLILSLNWGVVSMTYYGVTMNASNLSGNFFLNFFLMGLAEIPGVFGGMLILDRLGRRWSNGGSMILGGIACLATIFPVLFGNDNLHGLTTFLAFLGKMSASAAFAIVYMFTAELLPTVVRTASMGACSCSARIGAMLAPYIAKSGELIGGRFGSVEPLLIFGALSIIAGLLNFLLPETNKQKLPDTIEEGEVFGRRNISKGNGKEMIIKNPVENT
ncbi:organic cation transporter protein-like [Mya arenaria]|uniref:organic cation transporter protein-like n=1 Tax=Mya arenaria TaxID=6604 RepID=UPI0022E3D96E|nr:organic cation transporter protein-like [Mya arenaria]